MVGPPTMILQAAASISVFHTFYDSEKRSPVPIPTASFVFPRSEHVDLLRPFKRCKDEIACSERSYCTVSKTTKPTPL